MSLALLVPGSAGEAYAAPLVCSAGASVVLHATYGPYDDVTIAFSKDSIAEAYSSHGRDYGLSVGADAQRAWRIDENGVLGSDVGDAKRDFMTLRALLCNDFTPPHSAGEHSIASGGWPASIQRDRATGAISRVEYLEDGSRQDIQIFRYGALQNGATVPTAWSVDGGQVFTASGEEVCPKIVSISDSRVAGDSVGNPNGNGTAADSGRAFCTGWAAQRSSY